ncbi:hypothetical protein [Sandaracinus amylolyticus]|uniref:Uncharacterized protein n=1 Tax=Sandaracinus amylolyticus TaxID=927083 RepID=A0A0F6YGH1_9BACT|nr:hypothetical protein [Sandaracinus amylolyticus]AKF03666.1 hypothetical protein DB32_000815 [Sandaracinus amylolyticus]
MGVCGNYEDVVEIVAPGASTTVRQPPPIGYVPLGAGRYRFSVDIRGVGGAQARAEADFEFGAFSPSEIAEAHERALDASLEGCHWYPSYVQCVLEATSEAERATIVRALADRGPETLGAIVQALAYVDDVPTVRALLDDEQEALRLASSAALLRLRSAWLFPNLSARREDALALVTRAIASPGATSMPVLAAASETLEPILSVHDAWLARLGHEDEAVHIAWIARELAGAAWTSRLDEARRVAAIEALAGARERVAALREGALGAHLDHLVSVLDDPRATSSPPEFIPQELTGARGDASSAHCVDPGAIVTRTLEGCRSELWMRATVTATRVVAAER